jgi:hypothetical protein
MTKSHAAKSTAGTIKTNINMILKTAMDNYKNYTK